MRRVLLRSVIVRFFSSSIGRFFNDLPTLVRENNVSINCNCRLLFSCNFFMVQRYKNHYSNNIFVHNYLNPIRNNFTRTRACPRAPSKRTIFRIGTGFGRYFYSSNGLRRHHCVLSKAARKPVVTRLRSIFSVETRITICIISLIFLDANRFSR